LDFGAIISIADVIAGIILALQEGISDLDYTASFLVTGCILPGSIMGWYLENRSVRIKLLLFPIIFSS